MFFSSYIFKTTSAKVTLHRVPLKDESDLPHGLGFLFQEFPLLKFYHANFLWF